MAYTATNWVEGVTTLGPTNMNKIETELVYLDTRIPPAALSYGTTLPGSPVDGQEAVLVDSTTNPTYQWRFRYNAGSSSAYKWEFVGGSSGRVSDTATTGIGAVAAWAGGFTPTFAAPRAGDYRIDARIGLVAGGTAGTLYAGVSKSSASNTPLDNSQATLAANGQAVAVAMATVTMTATEVISIIVYASVTGMSILGRAVTVTPVRVS
jgi:hypothetical protein